MYFGAALLAALAAVCVGIGTTMPLSLPTPDQQPPMRVTQTASERSADDEAQATQSDALDEAALRRVARLDLRQPLFDEPKPDQAAQAQPEPEPTPTIHLQLIGTAHEPGRSVAMVQLSDGSVELCEAGERFEHSGVEVRVTAVQRRAATVEVGGRAIRLEIPEQDGSAGGRAQR